MPCGDSGQDGEEPSSPEESGKGGGGGGGGGGRQSVLSEQRGRGERANGPGLEEPSGGEAGPEDVEMTSGPQDLSSFAHHSPSCSTSRKSSKSGAGSSSFSLHSALSGQAGQRAGASSGSERMEASGGQAQREMMATMAEMKKRLPSDKRGRRKGSTVDALHYALNCVKQVQANSEYYKLLMSSGQEEQRDATGCSLEELERVLSEHTLKNTDSFVVLFSLADGRVKYASEQAPSILRCKRKFLESAKFVELLFHQDVNVFYSHTAQPHLPPWSNSRSAAVLFEYAQVKSFFCRVRGGKDRDGEMRYNPFRITPYLQMVQGSGSGRVKEDPCCLVLAERIISGYEAPRIPTDKRIFTTTHSPGCVFLEVDDRAVPLLGYLPQDLIGTSLLTCVHPEDRLLVLSMHRKVLKHAGQPPFEHPPLRLRCQSGDHITLETSWSSFINPWSRKVAFIIGRHKVRTSPLNEDVFAARSKDDPQVSYEEVKGLQAMIHKLFQKPVHNKGSSGYGSLVSNGSHEHHISVASSSDSNGNLWEDSHRQPMTLRQICADVNRVKSWGQQVCLDSRSKLPALCKPATEPPPPGATHAVVRGHKESRKQTHTPSYQQINCVDSIIRYLESCRGPALKRKSYARSVATSSSSSSSSSTSEDDKPAAVTDTAPASSDGAVLDSQVCVLSAAAVVVGTPLTDLTLSTKAMSMVSATSQCSYSSTIVHVAQPDSEVTALEDSPMGSEPADPPPARPAPGPAPSPASEELRLVGLTKEVLSAHTQKEEQEYVDRFRHRILQSPYSTYLQQDDGSTAHSHPPGDQAMRPVSAGRWTRTRTGKPKHKRAKAQDWPRSHLPPPGPPLLPHSSWPSSESSQPYAPVPQLHTPVFSVMGAQPVTGPEQPAPLQTGGLPTVLRPEQSQASYSFTLPDPSANLQLVQMESNFQSHNFESIQVQNLQNIHSYPNLQPMAPALAMSPYVDPVVTPVVAVILPSYPPYYPAMYSPPAPSMLPTPTFSIAGTGPYPQPQPQFQQPPDPQSPPDPVSFSPGASSSFGGDEEEEEAGPPALFSSSRSSSPLQLNLLQEELPGASDGQGCSESFQEQHGKRGEAPLSESGNLTQSSEQLDLLLLQEDPRSGLGAKASCSASGASGALGSASGSNGTSTSHTDSGKSGTYFASNNSFDTSPGALRSRPEPADRQQLSFDPRTENPVWDRHIPEHILMTYQIHSRDQREVLAEDKERLRLLLPRQPWFSQEQKEELCEVHPWIRQRTIPREIDSQGCVSCFSGAGDLHSSHRPAPDSCPMESPQRDT